MLVNEIISEARRNPEQNNVRNGKAEAIKYLESLPTLDRVFVHTSYEAKVGVRPMTKTTYSPVEPLGIYCYAAADWLHARGDMRFASTRQYINILTLKPTVRVLSYEGYLGREEKLEQRLASGRYPASDFTPGRMNGYYRDLGYGLINTNHGGLDDWCILHRGVIAHTETFRDVVIGHGQEWGRGGGMDNGDVVMDDPRFEPYDNPGQNWINWQNHRSRPSGKKDKWGYDQYIPNHAYPLKPQSLTTKPDTNS